MHLRFPQNCYINTNYSNPKFGNNFTRVKLYLAENQVNKVRKRFRNRFRPLRRLLFFFINFIFIPNKCFILNIFILIEIICATNCLECETRDKCTKCVENRLLND